MRCALALLLLPCAAAAGPLTRFDPSLGSQAITPPSYVDSRTLAAGVAETFPIPVGATRVMFSANAPFRAAYTPTGAADVAATNPAGDVADGSASELNPAVRNVAAFSKISLISVGPCDISLAYFF